VTPLLLGISSIGGGYFTKKVVKGNRGPIWAQMSYANVRMLKQLFGRKKKPSTSLLGRGLRKNLVTDSISGRANPLTKKGRRTESSDRCIKRKGLSRKNDEIGLRAKRGGILLETPNLLNFILGDEEGAPKLSVGGEVVTLLRLSENTVSHSWGWIFCRTAKLGGGYC